MEPKVTMMFPRNREDGAYLELLAHFAARRARTLKTHEELMGEVAAATETRREQFLNAVIREEWALDVNEMSFFMWDVENVPSWMGIEFFRHRFLAREWSFEQRSKRAIYGETIPVHNPFAGEAMICKDEHGKELDFGLLFEDIANRSRDLMALMHRYGVPAEKVRYAALEGSDTAFCVAANARTLHHVFTLRGSEFIGGDGNAHPLFQEVADDMYRQAQEVCPLLFPELLRS